ncbi:MAG: TatD family hydrolase [Patescibacteria group bacterium]
MFKNGQHIIDTHCHLQFPVYDSDRGAVIGRAHEAGVKMIVAGTQISTSQAAIGLAHKYPDDIRATIGFHPSHAVIEGWHHDKYEQEEKMAEKFDIQKLKELAVDSKVVGIGECGLDYYHLVESQKVPACRQAGKVKSMQKEVFMEMAGLAADLKKPLVIHCRPSKDSNDAYLDLLEMLKNRGDIEFKILHCFSGDLEIAKKMVDVGFYFTLGGIVTFLDKKNKNKGAYDEIVRYIPIERIMAETDSPYIAPVPHRGKRNEPSFVVEVVKKLAEIKNIPLDDLIEKISGTVNKIFKF